jgi:hypothetical protein
MNTDEELMKSFTVRAKGFEVEFKRNQELLFQVTARHNRLFGLWAAVRLGLPAGEEAEAYAKTVVATDFEAPVDARPRPCKAIRSPDQLPRTARDRSR